MPYSFEHSIVLICEVCGETETVTVDSNNSLVSRAKRNGWILGSYRKCFCSVECFRKRTTGHPDATHGDPRLILSREPGPVPEIDDRTLLSLITTLSQKKFIPPRVLCLAVAVELWERRIDDRPLNRMEAYFGRELIQTLDAHYKSQHGMEV